MGATFLRTMNIPELVAKSRSDYVRTAVRLWSDKLFYTATVEKILTRLHIVWEDMEYSYSWYQLLSRSVGLPSLTWIEYITQTGRDVTYETNMRDERTANRDEFDRVWGSEEWLLESGVAVLESHLTVDQMPRVFNDWKSSDAITHTVTDTDNDIDTDTDIDIVTVTHTNNDKDKDTQTYTDTDTDTVTDTVAVQTTDTDKVPFTTTTTLPATDTATTSTTDTDTATDTPYSPLTDISIEEIDTVINNLTDVSTHKSALQLMRQLAKSYHLVESYRLGQAISNTKKYQFDPQFLLDFGFISYYRGEYESAFEYCTQALVLVPESILVLQCIGVAGMYIPGKIIPALTAFKKSANLVERTYVEDENIENHIYITNNITNNTTNNDDNNNSSNNSNNNNNNNNNNDNSNNNSNNNNNNNNVINNNGSDLTSEVCKYTNDAILSNLLLALYKAGEHKEASQIICRVSDLPLVEYGGTVPYLHVRYDIFLLQNTLSD